MHQVVRSVHLLQVLHVSDSVSGEAVLLQELLGLQQVAVIRSVVQEDDVEVGVVLDQQRCHSFFVAAIVDVVVAGDDDAEGQLVVFV